MFSNATAYDAATRSVRTLGRAKAFVYAIDLRGGRSHAPVQLSSATNVDGMVQAVALDAAGDDAWVDATSDGGHEWAIRSTMAATDALLSMDGHVPLRDPANGLPQ